jgi:predicted enzyme related to lactoylglutathione lyase
MMNLLQRSTLILGVLVTSCTAFKTSPTPLARVVYFEIPVKNLDRAVCFYAKTFGVTLERQTIDGHAMALFPDDGMSSGASGALAYGKSYEPSRKGTRVYFTTTDLDATLQRAIEAGGRLLYPKTDIGSYGYVAEFEDSEGNCIALHMKKR